MAALHCQDRAAWRRVYNSNVCMLRRHTMIYRTRIVRVGTDAGILLPPDLVSRLGYNEGDSVRLSVDNEGEGPSRLIVEPVASAQARTVIKDRYQGCYSGARYIAWPLPAHQVPEASQGDDLAAADFWLGASHLCGKGATEEEALANLECLLAEHGVELQLGAAAGEIDAPEPAPARDDAARKMIEGGQ